MAGRMINGAAALAELVRPARDADGFGTHRVLPVLPELSGLLPSRGLRRGSTIAIGQPSGIPSPRNVPFGARTPPGPTLGDRASRAAASDGPAVTPKAPPSGGAASGGAVSGGGAAGRVDVGGRVFGGSASGGVAPGGQATGGPTSSDVAGSRAEAADGSAPSAMAFGGPASGGSSYGDMAAYSDMASDGYISGGSVLGTLDAGGLVSHRGGRSSIVGGSVSGSSAPAFGSSLAAGSSSFAGSGVSLAGSGSTSLLLALLAAASSAGSWCAVVGVPALGALAAAESGIALDRLALVPNPGPEWPTVVAALIDGVDVVVIAVPGQVSGSITSRLVARARQRGCVLMPYGRWDGADVTLQVVQGRWEGLGAGHGRLRRRKVTVIARGRGAAARPKEITMWMPGIAAPPPNNPPPNNPPPNSPTPGTPSPTRPALVPPASPPAGDGAASADSGPLASVTPIASVSVARLRGSLYAGDSA